jgi:exodeoxyribonuclease V gamma subunit
VVHLYSADRAEPLAARLAQVLIDEPGDPMQSEWLAVPTEGMRRWLVLELARYLGATGDGSGDGVTANVTRAFPGTLRNLVLDVANGGEPDPWHIDRMVWSLLALFEQLVGAGAEPDFTRLAASGSRFTRVRAVADLFDRYHLHRPEMIRAWAVGDPVDGNLAPLPTHLTWQHRVWCQLRSRIGRPSPPERLPGLLEDLRTGELELDVPDRLLLFGFTSLPGREFLDLVSAVGARHDVHLFLVGPSRMDGERLRTAWPIPSDRPARSRIDDPTAPLIHQPLLRTWGRVARETALLVSDADATVFGTHQWVDAVEFDEVAPTTLLGRLQHDIRFDTVLPARDVAAGDRSVQFHACFGQMRQAEVARDALLHILKADQTITEEDILVVCPGLEQFAPLVDAAFRVSSPNPDAPGAPALRFQIADRSIRSVNPVVGSLTQLVELLSGRFEVGPVVDFISSAPIRQRFGLDDDALGAVVDWVTRTHVRWGLDAKHREVFDMPVAVDGNTWQSALDRLLLGAATLAGDFVLAVGDIAPAAVDGGDTDTLGSLATILARLADLTVWAGEGRHPLSEWVDRLEDACTRLLSVPETSTWQFDALRRVLEEILEAAGAVDGRSGPLVDLRDVRRLLDGKLGSEAGRPDFFRGGVTVTSMTPLRWVPFRVVCILGFDQEFVGAPAADAADLVAASPQVGDPDRRIEWRQSLLETVLAAQDHLVVVRDGHDVRTSQEIPRAVAAAELFDATVDLAPADQRDALRRRLEVVHPRHGFDDACLGVDRLVTGLTWSFDPEDVARAAARRSAAADLPPPARRSVAGPASEVIDLDELRSFLADPVAAFATAAVQMALPRTADTDDVILPVEPGPLESSDLGRRLLAARWEGVSAAEWLDFERRQGTLPPGALEPRLTAALESETGSLVDEAVRRGVHMDEPEHHIVEVTLDDGTRIVGSIPLLLSDETPGPARVRFTRSRPTFTLEAWLDLMSLTASDPDRNWRSLSISRGDKDEPIAVVDIVAAGAGEDRILSSRTALSAVVRCFRAGMCEPLPLFPRFSKSVADGKPEFSAWSGHQGRGDRGRPATAFFFGHLNATELLALDPIDGDPDGTGGRVRRWADFLWGTVAATSREFGG